jgi:CRP/FNR family transcriptional regulator, cyclic AMP receptor protein
VLGARNYQANSLVHLLPEPVTVSAAAEAISNDGVSHRGTAIRDETWAPIVPDFGNGTRPERRLADVASQANPDLGQLLYLFACEMEWERSSSTTAAWEMLSATRSSDEGLRAHALSLLERFEKIENESQRGNSANQGRRRNSSSEGDMRIPYGLEIIESCMGCKASREGFFCRFSTPVTRATDVVSHHTVMPAGAVLFIEGQTPRGVFILCSGKVKLSTTSKEGKVLILKQAEAGEVLGLSAAISGTNYEMTAETASACQLNFIGRTDLMFLLQNQSEVGLHSAVWLSREFQGAYRDIHDLVLARSSSGKLARLLLSCAPPTINSQEQHLRSAMTHEEMAQRIGSSRETVTRLLSELKKKRLIRLEGASLVIRDRSGLEALAV